MARCSSFDVDSPVGIYLVNLKVFFFLSVRAVSIAYHLDLMLFFLCAFPLILFGLRAVTGHGANLLISRVIISLALIRFTY